MQTICRRVDETGSAVTHRAGSARPVCVAAAGKHFDHSVQILSGQMKLITEKSKIFEVLTKSCANLIRYSRIFNAQLYVHLKK